jgi:hypothetical protein
MTGYMNAISDSHVNVEMVSAILKTVIIRDDVIIVVCMIYSHTKLSSFPAWITRGTVHLS